MTRPQLCPPIRQENLLHRRERRGGDDARLPQPAAECFAQPPGTGDKARDRRHEHGAHGRGEALAEAEADAVKALAVRAEAANEGRTSVLAI